MTTRRVVAAAVVVGMVGAAAWWGTHRHRARPVPAGALSATWYGSYKGTMTLPAVLRWCPVSRTGLLEAVSGDSGVALVFFEQDGLVSLVHTVFPAENGSTAPRPAATMAMRWVRTASDTSLVAMRSVSGSARLSVVNGIVSGDATVRTRAINSRDTLIVRTTFQGVKVVTAAAGCT